MRRLPAAAAPHLTAPVSTLCWCWRVIRRDGIVLGFTDHDRDLVFDGTTFEAAAGLAASDAKDAVGLGTANLEVEGALSSERITEGDLAAGFYDVATVEIFRVHWPDAEHRVLVRKGTLGEIRRKGTRFEAEVRGLAHQLQHPTGRLFQHACDASLGDTRCGLAVGAPPFTASAVVLEITSLVALRVAGIETHAADWFTRGRLSVVSGAASGYTGEIKRYQPSTASTLLSLWQPAPSELAPGDQVSLTAGCDKQPETCRGKFANMSNFRGFPHIPGNDFASAYARAGAPPRVGNG
jgi:uncharacterized phage protein (TIGR02218 family)